MQGEGKNCSVPLNAEQFIQGFINDLAQSCFLLSAGSELASEQSAPCGPPEAPVAVQAFSSMLCS